MLYSIPIFLVVHFGENFVKIRSKIPKLQMHEKFHKNVNENIHIFMQFFTYFYGEQIKEFYTANFLYVLIHLKRQSSRSFPNLMVRNVFFPPSLTGPDFR